jgi:hypothetical protein
MAKFHTRITDFPFARAIPHARLVDLREEQRGQRLDVVMDIQELVLKAPPELFLCEGSPCERVEGFYTPLRLRFSAAAHVRRDGLYAALAGVPPEHPCRELRGMLSWVMPGAQPYYLLWNASGEDARLSFFARGCKEEAVPPHLDVPPEAVSLVRGWSPAPPAPARLVPAPGKLHANYGGDPITIWLNGRVFHRRLFIGGVEEQPRQRPGVDAVLNLGEVRSRWVPPGEQVSAAADRWDHKGEGDDGMDPAEMAAEARWVIDHLKEGHSVLVHCYAGMNRSAVVCCAVLILLEGLSAEDALERVRRRHPWARPDSRHWINLRWLAKEMRLKRSL